MTQKRRAKPPRRKHKDHRGRRGEGTVFWSDERRRYVAQIDLGVINGTRKRPKRTFLTETEAWDWLADVRQQVRGGVRLDDRATTWEYLDRWLEDMRPQWGTRTYQENRRKLERYAQPAIGAVLLRELDGSHVQTLLSRLLREPQSKGKPLGLRTVRTVRNLLSQALKQAKEQKRTTIDAAREGVRLQKQRGVKGFTGRALEVEEAKALLQAARCDAFEALWTLALTTGLRPAELLGIRRRDLDLAQGLLRVEVTIETKGRREIKPPKTEGSVRTLRLIPMAVDAIRRRLALQAEAQLRAGSSWHNPEGFIFTTDTGQVLLWGNVYRRSFRPLIAIAKVPAIRPYDLRHSAASLLLSEGVPIHEVSEYLGHSNPNTTLAVYSHVLKKNRERSAQVMEQLFGG